MVESKLSSIAITSTQIDEEIHEGTGSNYRKITIFTQELKLENMIGILLTNDYF